MAKETIRPLATDWCRQTDPPCPYENPDCGINRHLRHSYGKRRIAEAKRLLALAKENPDGFWQTCARALWEQPGILIRDDRQK